MSSTTPSTSTGTPPPWAGTPPSPPAAPSSRPPSTEHAEDGRCAARRRTSGAPAGGGQCTPWPKAALLYVRPDRRARKATTDKENHMEKRTLGDGLEVSAIGF